jgi:hypothetical protein
MRPIKLIKFFASLAFASCYLMAEAQTNTTNVRIEASINGAPLIGSAEIDQLVAGKTIADRNSIIQSAIVDVRKNESFRLIITLIDNGKKTDLTKSANITYEHDGCITVSSSGFVSITPSRACAGQNNPSLAVVLTSSDKKNVVAMNEYFFHVKD